MNEVLDIKSVKMDKDPPVVVVLGLTTVEVGPNTGSTTVGVEESVSILEGREVLDTLVGVDPREDFLLQIYEEHMVVVLDDIDSPKLSLFIPFCSSNLLKYKYSILSWIFYISVNNRDYLQSLFFFFVFP